jgi:cytochrome c peroxidase
MRCAALLFAATLAGAEKLPVPAGLDEYLPVPEANPLTREKVALGRKLFFDTRLSRDNTVSCATCHDPDHAFTDSRPLAVGIGGRVGNRRVPRIANRVYGALFFWDGRAATLEEQVIQPISNPREMDLPVEAAAARAGLDVRTLQAALASYVRTILAGDAPYDRYLQGDTAALTDEQRAGLRLFRGKAGCAVCHVGPNLTDERLHNTGAGAADRSGRFKTPSLRDAARTPPYMHDGSIATLEEVVDFYDNGGKPNPHLDPDLRPLQLTAGEKASLVAFLRALNGRVRDGM